MFPNAFTRSRKLPLPSLIAALLSMRGTSQQVMLDSFFGSLGGDGGLHRTISDRGFAKARDHLSWNALQRLNTFAVAAADRLGLIPRWQGLRVVAADTSVFFPTVRACVKVCKVAGAIDFTREPESASETFDLVLDRGYPATWLVAYLNEHKIRFCMRCDKVNGWKAMRALLDSGNTEATVTLKKPNQRDVTDYQCVSAD